MYDLHNIQMTVIVSRLETIGSKLLRLILRKNRVMTGSINKNMTALSFDNNDKEYTNMLINRKYGLQLSKYSNK